MADQTSDCVIEKTNFLPHNGSLRSLPEYLEQRSNHKPKSISKSSEVLVRLDNGHSSLLRKARSAIEGLCEVKDVKDHHGPPYRELACGCHVENGLAGMQKEEKVNFTDMPKVAEAEPLIVPKMEIRRSASHDVITLMID